MLSCSARTVETFPLHSWRARTRSGPPAHASAVGPGRTGRGRSSGTRPRPRWSGGSGRTEPGPGDPAAPRGAPRAWTSADLGADVVVLLDGLVDASDLMYLCTSEDRTEHAAAVARRRLADAKPASAAIVGRRGSCRQRGRSWQRPSRRNQPTARQPPPIRRRRGGDHHLHVGTEILGPPADWPTRT